MIKKDTFSFNKRLIVRYRKTQKKKKKEKERGERLKDGKREEGGREKKGERERREDDEKIKKLFNKDYDSQKTYRKREGNQVKK